MVEVLKQDQYVPLAMARQVMIIYAGTQGYLDDLPVEDVARFEVEFFKYAGDKYPDLEKDIAEKKELTDDIVERLKKLVEEFKGQFKPGE